MADPYASNSATPGSFGTRGAVVVPNDGADLANVAKAIVVTAAGNLVIIPAGNADAAPITFTDVPAGFIPPYRVRRVKSTGTTASVATVEG